MTTKKVTITIDSDLLSKVDLLVSQRVFPNRSKAIQAALIDKLFLLHQNRFASECAKLDPQVEQQFAEEWIDRIQPPTTKTVSAKRLQ
jgi:Arc/MetJ-type ribon-helix-helix transcriptional regulator